MNKFEDVILDDDNCFACGTGNPVGLRLKFSIEPDSGRAEARTVIAEHFNGWFGAVHGGIITTLLDETMVYACTSIGWMTVTGTIEVKFHRPVPTEEPIVITGEVEENRGRSITARGRIEHSGEILATARAVMIPIRNDENALASIRDRLIQ